jgi:hypothetical protein
VVAAAATTTAASAVPAFASASAATSATWTAAATSATATATGPSASAFAHRPGFIHHQRTTEKILAIAGLNGAIGFFVVTELREPESARLTGKLIADDLNGIRLKSVPREPVLQLGFTGLVRKVAYKQFFQGSSFGPIQQRRYGWWAHNNPSSSASFRQRSRGVCRILLWTAF